MWRWEESKRRSGVIRDEVGAVPRPPSQTGRADFPHPAFQLLLLPYGLFVENPHRYALVQGDSGKHAPLQRVGSDAEGRSSEAFALTRISPEGHYVSR